MTTAPANIASLTAVDLASKKAVRLHPLRRLRIERWTYTHAIAATLMGALAIFATFEAWQDIFQWAYGEAEYSHIFLVPIVSLWMVFSRRLRIRHCKPIATALGIAIVLTGWTVYTFGYYNGYQSLWHLGAIIVLIGSVVTVLGKHALFRFFPAVAVLVFMVPVPQHYRLEIAQPLQTWTAEVSHAVLDLSGVPVQRNGDSLIVNGQPVMIAEACNGLRMVFALFLVSYAFSFGLPLRSPVRLIVLLASPLSAILCNVVRVVPTACVYGYMSVKVGDKYECKIGDQFHEYFGWLMLPVSFLILLGVIRLLRWASIPVMKYSLAA